jgi:hypothetical protein
LANLALWLTSITARQCWRYEQSWVIEPLAPGMERPDLSETGYGVYWYRPDHIAEYLAAQRA